jgi:hypothetical protein
MSSILLACVVCAGGADMLLCSHVGLRCLCGVLAILLQTLLAWMLQER